MKRSKLSEEQIAYALRQAESGTHWLDGVTPFDPLTSGGTVLVLIVVAALVCWMPARRAAGVDPTAALRADG